MLRPISILEDAPGVTPPPAVQSPLTICLSGKDFQDAENNWWNLRDHS